MNQTCPKCHSEYGYQDRSLWLCPECSHAWSVESAVEEIPSVISDGLVKDSNGTVLSSGDSVVVVKDLKLKGSSDIVKRGTKVRNIRLSHAVDGHDIACKIDGIGAIHLKSEFVKKV